MIHVFKTASFWLLVICLAATFMVLSPNTKAMDDLAGNVKVTILVFSGRPNPVFMIEDDLLLDEIKTILDRANPNTEFKDSTVIPARLGYNGMIFENPAKKAGLPATISVYENNIELKNEQVRFLKDDGSMERLLLEQALEKKVIDQKIVDFIRSDKKFKTIQSGSSP